MATTTSFFLFLPFFLLSFFHGVQCSVFELEELLWLDEKDDEVDMVQSKHDSLRSCDFRSGKWVYDQSYPLYDDSSCPYLSSAVACQKNGRPDSDYEKWRWKPHGCSIPRWDFIMEGSSVLRNLNPMVAYQKGLTTWAKWVDLNLDPRSTQVIFRSMSPRHNRQNGLKYYNQREPLGNASHTHVPELVQVLQGELRRMSFPVYLQDVTAMSALRKDGHPSVYARAMGQEEKQHLRDYTSDCSHWCLPGVPDIWNEMLSTLI